MTGHDSLKKWTEREGEKRRKRVATALKRRQTGECELCTTKTTRETEGKGGGAAKPSSMKDH